MYIVCSMTIADLPILRVFRRLWITAPAFCIFCLLTLLNLAVVHGCGVERAGRFLGRGRAYLEMLPRSGACRVTVRLRLVETPFREGRLGSLSTRTSMTAELLGMRCLGDDCVRPARGTVVLFPWGDCQPFPEALLPGQCLTATGTLRPPPGAPPLEFYPRHLASRDVWRILAVEEYALEEMDDGLASRWRRGVHRLRAAAACRLIRGIDDDEIAGAVLALGLGMSQFISRESRQRQLDAGTVHVFAISGMHLGFVALLMTWLLRWSLLRLRWQWLGVGAVALGYTVLTGAATSALRALLMAWVVIFCRLRMRPPSWLNALGVAGCCTVLARPLAVLDLGFVYSYGVMATLLLSEPLISAIGNAVTERLAWLPRRNRRHLPGMVSARLLQGLAGSFLAWLSSCATAMALNPRLALLSPLYNIPLGTVVFVALTACPLRLAAGVLLPWLDGAWARLLAACMGAMLKLAEAGAHSALCMTVAGYTRWCCLAFHLALALWMLVAVDRCDDWSGKAQ